MAEISAYSEAGHGSGPRKRQIRKIDSAVPFASAKNKKRKLTWPDKVQDPTNILAGYGSELQDMLEGLAIQDDDETFVTTNETTVIDADIYSVASSHGEWLTDAILRFVVQHYRSQFDPQASHISLVGPSECQWISSVGQQEGSEITDRDRQALEGRKYLFVVVNDAELGTLAGSHWSLLIMDTETGTASHYNSLPSFEPQANAARRAVTGVGRILKRKFAFREESQTPHQTNDNLTKTESGPCGPFVLFVTRYFLDKIFEPNGQLKSNPRVCLPPGPGEYRFTG